MNLRLIKVRDALSDSFWFLPLVMTLLAGGAALGSVALDHAFGGDWIKSIGWVWSGGGEGARGVLTVIAGSVMTVVSIVFSLTVTTLAQTSSHYGPRVLRNFIADRFVQFTLGTFVSTFVYCLLVLRTVRSDEADGFVPHLSVNIGVVLALTSLAVLIFFIHHIAQSIQAESLIAEVGEDLEKSLSVLFPERIGHPSSDGGIESIPPAETEWKAARMLESSRSGYLQRVDDEHLMRLATQHDLILKLEKRPGDFVAGASLLVRVLAPAAISEAVERRLHDCFILGRHRTPHQDVLFMVQQLVEIAAHALSPGINEPFTALNCIDWLGVSLRGVAGREIPNPLRRDENGQLRVVAPTLDFEEMVRAAFDQIRLYGASNPDVMLRLLQVIGEIAPDVRRNQDHEVLVRHTRLIGGDAAQIANEAERSRVSARVQETLRTLSRNDTQG